MPSRLTNREARAIARQLHKALPACHVTVFAIAQGVARVEVRRPDGEVVMVRSEQDAARLEQAISERSALGRPLQNIRTGRGVTLVGIARDLKTSIGEIVLMEQGWIEPSAEYLSWCGVQKGDAVMMAPTAETEVGG